MAVKPYHTERTKKEEVREMFDRIAPRYDLLNHVLSLDIDKLWRRRVVAEVARSAPREVLDVATGTGDLALGMARRMPECRITGVDLSERMLAEARRKAAARKLDDRTTFEQGDAEHLAAADGAFDAVTVAFGVRNFGDLDAGLRELARVTRPGGRAVILEFSQPRNRVIRALYGFYAGHILPRIGGAVSRDRQAYDYLPASVQAFPAPEAFCSRMLHAGFAEVRVRSLSCGIAHIYIGYNFPPK